MRSLYLAMVSILFLSCMKGPEPKSLPDINYFNELVSGDSAKLFAHGIISTDSFEHSAPAFAPDGSIVLWSVMELPNYRSRIWESRYAGRKWSTPQVAAFADTTVTESSPCFSPDGNRIVFSSGRRLPSGKYPSRGNALWEINKTEAGWSSPQVLDTLLFETGNYSPSISASGNLYYTHGPFRSPDWNIRFANPMKPDEKSATLLLPVNTSGYEDGAYIAPDESYIIFESDRPGGIGGSIDLYIAFRSGDTWTSPRNLGPKVNTDATERFARVSPDGKFLFFGSNRRVVNGSANFDVYWISTTAIDVMKP